MFVALGIQPAVCMRRVVLSCVACPAVQYLSTLFHTQYDFRGGKKKHIVCFDFLYNFCLKHVSFYEELSKI